MTVKNVEDINLNEEMEREIELLNINQTSFKKKLEFIKKSPELDRIVLEAIFTMNRITSYSSTENYESKIKPINAIIP